ncbi:MAG: family 16 glycosylhydrolase, partial [Bacteroidales bacterium]|nr:family 16 glycosylhydrolase [Bacteroidales bacterium]
ENGNLVVEARKENYGGMEYTSARLVTRQKGDWLYGRMEAYAKLPSGRGTWPAIWMLPTNWAYGSWPKSGEIDIMEYVGYDPGVVHGSIHTEAYNHVIGTQVTSTINVPTAETAYHLYAVEWGPEKIDIYVDNTKYFTFANEHTDYTTWPFDKAFHLLLNIAVGGNWGGAQGVDPNIWPQKMLVDYVRVYQSLSAEQIFITGPGYVAPNQTGVSFTIPNIVNASYIWTIPNDATIVSGQGTNSIVVNWGEQAGEVSVQITHPQAGGTYTYNVKTSTTPSGDRYSLVNFKHDGIEGWSGMLTGPNTINLNLQDSLLRVDYNITDPSAFPYFAYTLPNPVDMSSFTVLNIWMKTWNFSNSVVLRADLFDTDNRLTDVSPVFKFSPVEPGGQFHVYSFDFKNKWGSNSPEYGQVVNQHQVKGVRFYVDYGIYGKVAADSLWLSDIAISTHPLSASYIQQKSQFLSVYPNPCNDYICLYFDSQVVTTYRVSIYTIEGSLAGYFESSQNPCFISTKQLPSGVYVVTTLNSEGFSARVKLVKL